MIGELLYCVCLGIGGGGLRVMRICGLVVWQHNTADG